MALGLVMAARATRAEEQVSLPIDVSDGLENSWSIGKDRSATGVKPYKAATTLWIDDLPIDLDFGREVSIHQDRIEKIIFDRDPLEKLSGEELRKQEEVDESREL